MAKTQVEEAIAHAPTVVTEPARRPYRVLKPIHLARGTEGIMLWDAVNLKTINVQGQIDSEVAYYPAGAKISATVPSGGHGRPIPTDTAGIIRLTDEEAAKFRDGQIEPLEAGGVEVPSGFLDLEDQEQRLLLQREMELAGADPLRDRTSRLLEHQRQIGLLQSQRPTNV